MSKHRWKAEIYYKGGVQEHIYFDEYDELGDYIEKGPDWNCIERTVVTLNPECITRPGLTYQAHIHEVEQSYNVAA